MDKIWNWRSLPDETKTLELSKALNINKNLSALLLQRDIDSFETAKAFFRPKLDELHDPFLMKGMHNAVDRLCEAVFNKEKVLIYGDYDVDGTTSVALVYSFLGEFCEKDQLQFYIPDRYAEGYGLSSKGVKWAADHGFQLIITLDCGIKAFETSELAHELGIDLIICDHHLPATTLPRALAILDPKQVDCAYPYKELSGCGVGFKLMQGFCHQNTIPEKELFKYLDFVAISIACDIVPITGENRILAFYGLKKINQAAMPPIKALQEVSGLSGPLSISDLVFYLGPRINAAGRLSHAKKAVDLLIDHDEKLTKSSADTLNVINTERKRHDESTTLEALEMIGEQPDFESLNTTVLFNENWHKGIVGIVASRCIEKYYRPTIILTKSNGKITGSARSVAGFDIYQAIESCSDLLEKFGGHHHAAGLSLTPENLDLFKQKFETVVSKSIAPEMLIPSMLVDLNVDLSFVNFKSHNIIRQMAPFGPANLNPVFSTEKVKLSQEPRLLQDKHLKLQIQQGKKKMEGIGFNLGHLADKLRTAPTFDIAYQVEENNYMGHKSLQLVLKDIRFHA